MAKRGPSHNFIKQEKERKRLKKAALKNDRRNLKKQQSVVEENTGSPDDDAMVDSTDLEMVDVESGSHTESVPKTSAGQ